MRAQAVIRMCRLVMRANSDFAALLVLLDVVLILLMILVQNCSLFVLCGYHEAALHGLQP